MFRILVWDAPVRLFHWLFAGGFLAAFGIAVLSSHRSPVFPFHMLIGLAVGLMIALRMVWGLAGTRYARFRSFLFGPGALLAYLRGVFTRRGQRHVGHNPGSAYAAFAMLALVAATLATGVLMPTNKKLFEEVHEALAWTTVVVAGLHVLGVIWHSVQFRENLPRSMVDGRKRGELEAGIRSARPVAGIAFLLAVTLWAAGLYRNYDAAARRTELPVLGVSVQLGSSRQAKQQPKPAQAHSEHHADKH